MKRTFIANIYEECFMWDTDGNCWDLGKPDWKWKKYDVSVENLHLMIDKFKRDKYIRITEITKIENVSN